MLDYEIFILDNDINGKIVFITSTEDLYYLQDDIFDDFSKTNGPNFSILVDLFLRNGFSFNRFVSLRYEGRDRCQTFIVNPREVSEEIKTKVRNYLRANIDLLENSSLTKSTINFIKTCNV